VRDCRHKICTHPSEKRQFTETMTLIDCLYLEEIGCEIIKIFEANLYFQAERIFEKFLRFTSRNKIRHSQLPAGTNVFAFCDKVNVEMKYDDKLKLTPSLLQPNEHKAYMFKTMENSLFGKFAQAEKTVINTLVPNQQRLEQHFNSGKLIDYNILADKVAIVSIQNNLPRVSQNLNSIISSHVLSYSKRSMHRKSFCALSPYFYCLVIENKKTQELKTIMKCQGITSNTIESCSHFNYEAMRRDLKRSIEENVVRTMMVPQTKRRKLEHKDCKQNVIFNIPTAHKNNRIVLKKEKTYDTIPYGYKLNTTNLA